MKSGADVEMNKQLSKLEQKLCSSLHRFEVKGKRGNKVPVLLTDEMKKRVDILMEYRNTAGVLPTNPYVFAIPQSDNCLRGSDCLRKFAMECGAKHPENITSTRLRKHIATLSQLYNLKENEMDILAQFMGHDIRIHRNFYRLPEDTLQMATVSKILLAQENGKVFDFKGKSLEDIEVNMEG